MLNKYLQLDKKRLLIIALSAIFLVAGYLAWNRFTTNIVPSQGQPRTPEIIIPSTDTPIPAQTVIVENLTIPWDIAFLPNGEMLITEREGKLIHHNPETGESRTIPISAVKHAGEGGLLGIAIHPKFEVNSLLYLYLTSSLGGDSINSVVRYKYTDGILGDRTVIIDNIPGALFHNGGRIAFGPDEMLYIATGDARNQNSAQDTVSLAGKILRVRDDGSIPDDNPFGNAIYSYGHRNPQGLTWDDSGQLWSTEHGRSGILSGLDELNLIVKGANYGWPDSSGDRVIVGTITPILHSGPDVTWAPASAEYWDGSVFFGGLKGETLYEAVLEGSEVVELREHYVGEFGRIRTVILGPDGALYLTTSNRDGRGNIRKGDDKIIRLNPQQFR